MRMQSCNRIHSTAAQLLTQLQHHPVVRLLLHITLSTRMHLHSLQIIKASDLHSCRPQRLTQLHAVFTPLLLLLLHTCSSHHANHLKFAAVMHKAYELEFCSICGRLMSSPKALPL
jgi:hypothetical protein